MDERLKQKLSKLPAQPGVYFHKNAKGEIIYVGKAAVLKSRVRQYFQKSQKDPKTEALVKEIADTDWLVVDTEMDALFLESEMIKRYKPKWNILLRDDKTVSFVRIDMKSEVPYVSFTRTPMDDKAVYVGPFYGKKAVEQSLRILRRVFPYYVKPYTGSKTLDTDLGLTPGIEIGKSSTKDYKRNLRKLIRYLEGGREKLLHDLEKTMKKASAAGNYELAAEARDQLFGLKELKKKIVFSDKEFLDISSDQALKELQKLLAARDEYRKFKIRTSKNDDLKSMVEVITRRLKHQEWDYPDLIILDGGKTQVNAVLPLIQPLGIPVIGRDKSGDHSRNAKVCLVIPDNQISGSRRSRPSPRGERANSRAAALRNTPKSDYLEYPNNSHIARLIARIDEEAHRFAITYHTLLKRKSMLK